MGKARVDLPHRLEKLRQAYTGSLEEIILADLIANALDARASRVRLEPDAATSTLTISDDGRGMTRTQVSAIQRAEADTPTRPGSIGSAGVGLRLAVLLCDEVIIETRRPSAHVAARWQLATRNRAQLKWISPPGLCRADGTAVRLHLSNPMSPLLDTGYLEEAVRTHFAALFDPACDRLLRRSYRDGVNITIGNRQPVAQARTGERVVLPVTFGGKRLPAAIVTMERHARPVPEDQQGIALSTKGRVIARGWHLLGLAPACAWRVTGLVEAPELALHLKATKTDFVRTSTDGGRFPAYRKAVQAVVSRQLAEWGEPPDAEANPRAVRIERELERILARLGPQFPALRSLSESQDDAQTPLPLPEAGGGETLALFPPGPAPRNGTPGDNGAGASRFGLLVRFEARRGDDQAARLADRTIWINTAHPACVRAAASRASAYHSAVAIALALAPVAAPGAEGRVFVSRFLDEWGGLSADPGRSTVS